MKMRFSLFISLIFVISACTAQENPTGEGIPSRGIEQIEEESILAEVEQHPTEEVEGGSISAETPEQSENTTTPPPALETSGPDCYGSETHEIGLGIAEKFTETTYEQVMIWFCNGAEFEDILVALQTEKLTKIPAEEMLIMLADDWNWDEIWQLIGLTEE